MAGLAISRVVIGLEGAQYGVCWCIIGFNHSNAPCSHNDLWGVCVAHTSSLSILLDPLTNTLAHSLSHRISWHWRHRQTGRQHSTSNMHEIAHTDYFIAWTHPKVVYHRACERGNRIRAVVGWGRDLRRRHNASSRSTSTYRDRETARGWDEKADSLLFYFSPSHCSLSNPWLRLILLWCDMNLGRQRDIDRQRERGRYVFM